MSYVVTHSLLVWQVCKLLFIQCKIVKFDIDISTCLFLFLLDFPETKLYTVPQKKEERPSSAANCGAEAPVAAVEQPPFPPKTQEPSLLIYKIRSRLASLGHRRMPRYRKTVVTMEITDIAIEIADD